MARKKGRKSDWIWWAAAGAVIGLGTLGVGLVYFGPKENKPVVPPYAPDLPDISTDPFVNYSGAGDKLYNTPLPEFSRITSSQGVKKGGCGCGR